MVSIDLLGDKDIYGQCPYCGHIEFDVETIYLEIDSRVLEVVNFNHTDSETKYVINTCIEGHDSIYYNDLQYKIIE
jgi:hypothetical protein